jgi:hypothetical protein
MAWAGCLDGPGLGLAGSGLSVISEYLDGEKEEIEG